MQRKESYNRPRPYNQGGPKNIPQLYSYSQTDIPPYYPVSYNKRSDVGSYPGGGGTRVSVGVPQQYPPVGGLPPNSVGQVQQPSQNQQQQLRAQVPTLPSPHNPHSATSGVPPPSTVPHSQHHQQTHSGLAQHHQVLSSGAVSSSGGLVNSVQQIPAPGTSPAQQGPPHELHAQGMPQGSSPQIQQVAGVAIPSVMYSTNQNAQQPGHQQPNPQGQYFAHHSQQNAAHMHGGQQRQVIQHPQPTMHINSFPYVTAGLLHPSVLHSSNALYQPFALPQGRPVSSSGQHQYQIQQQPAPFQTFQYHHMQGTPVYFHQQPVKAPPSTHPKREKKNVIEIINPLTNKSIFDDSPDTSKTSEPASPEQPSEATAGTTVVQSSTPNLATSNIQAQFALQVTQVATGADETISKNDDSSASAISTNSASALGSHSDDLNDDIGENVRLSPVQTLDTITKESDSNKITRNVPESINVSRPQQPSSEPLSNPQRSTSPSTQLPPQPLAQRQPRPQRVAAPTSVISSQPQPVTVQQQLRPALKGGIPQPLQQPKQSPPQQLQQQQAPQGPLLQKTGVNQISQKVSQPQPVGYQSSASKSQISPSLGGVPNQKPLSQHPAKKQPTPLQMPLSQHVELHPMTHPMTHPMPIPTQVCHPSMVQQMQSQSRFVPPLGPMQMGIGSAPVQVQLHSQQMHPMHISPIPQQLMRPHPMGQSPPQVPPQIPEGMPQAESFTLLETEELPVDDEPPDEEVKTTPSGKLSTPVAALGDHAKSVTAPAGKAPVELQQLPGKRGKEKPENEISQPSAETGKEDAGEEVAPQPAEVGVISDGAAQEPQFSNPSQIPKSDSDIVSSTVKLEPVDGARPSEHPTEHPTKELKEEEEGTQPHHLLVGNSIDDFKVMESHWRDNAPHIIINKITPGNAEPSSLELTKDGMINNVDSMKNFAEGKRHYNREFLMQLKQSPLSCRRPESLPNLEVVLDGPHSMARDMKTPKMMQDFTPYFLPTSSRNRPISNMQGKSFKGSMQQKKPLKIIDIRLSSSSEVKLKTVENAWKPSTKGLVVPIDDLGTRHEELMKKMRGILNKLTPDNFTKLSATVKAFEIKNADDLKGLIDLVYEKAVDEQAFCTTYAQLCAVVSQITVMEKEPANIITDNKEEKTDKKEGKFRSLIIGRCQKEFEMDNTKNQKIVQMKKDLENFTGEDGRAERVSEIDYEETKLRKRSVGNVKFIGELYQLKMLTSSIMLTIMNTFLDRGNEESLECLCKLFTTIGKTLDENAKGTAKAKDELNDKFRRMEEIIYDKKSVSSRVRFLIMDVLDLRSNNWVPRREDTKPKTKAEVHEEIRKEAEMQQQQFSMMGSGPRHKDDRDRKKSRDSRGGGEDWNVVGQYRPRHSPIALDAAKFKTFKHTMPEQVELRAEYGGNWFMGSTGGGIRDQEKRQFSSNKFALLSGESGDVRRTVPINRFAPGGSPNPQGSFSSRSMTLISEKEPVLPTTKNNVNPGERSKSSSRSSSLDHSVSREGIASPPIIEDYDTISKFAKVLIEEYVSNKDIKEARICLDEKFHPSKLPEFVQIVVDWAADREQEKRLSVGRFFHNLFLDRKIDLSIFLEGTKPVLEMTADSILDIPQLCRHFGDIFAPLLMDEVLGLSDLLKVCKSAPENYDTEIFLHTLSSASKLLGIVRLTDLWKDSGLNWKELLGSEVIVEEFLKKYNLECTYSSESVMSKSDDQTVTVMDGLRIRRELLTIFRRNTSNEEIYGWIEANIGQNTNNPIFTRALTTALVESLMTISADGSSLVVGENFEANLKQKTCIITKYVDNIDILELSCILGIQSLSVENQHPQGLLEKCFKTFYYAEVLSEDSYFEWARNEDPEEQLGKGVCLNSVRNFLQWIQAAEVDDATQPSHSDEGFVDQVEEIQ